LLIIDWKASNVFSVSQVNINVDRRIAQVRDDRFWQFAAEQWYELYTPFVPMDTGNLLKNVSITPGQIEHRAPYAIYVYNGNFNFKQTHHPLASRMWDKAAEPTQKPKLVRILQKYVDAGRMKLDG